MPAFTSRGRPPRDWECQHLQAVSSMPARLDDGPFHRPLGCASIFRPFHQCRPVLRCVHRRGYIGCQHLQAVSSMPACHRQEALTIAIQVPASSGRFINAGDVRYRRRPVFGCHPASSGRFINAGGGRRNSGRGLLLRASFREVARKSGCSPPSDVGGQAVASVPTHCLPMR